MVFLSPLAGLLTAAVAGPLLVGLYFLKLRRQPRVVPSTLLWQRAVEDLEVNAPFQRLRNSLLLWLQLLLLGLLVLAVARPASDAPAPAGDRVVVLLDRSASMAVAEPGLPGGVGGGATRLDAAKAVARGVIDAMEPGASAMVVAFADTPEVVQPFSADRARLRAAVDAVRGGDRPGRPGRALALVGGLAGAQPPSAVYVVGDSPLDAEPPALAPGTRVRWVPVGNDPPNLGFTAVGARRGLREPDRVELFARLENAGPAAAEAGVTLDVGGQRLTTRRVSVPGRDAGGRPGRRDLEFGFRAPASEAVGVTLRHDRADPLAADDAARLLLPPAAEAPVVLVTPGGNPFLERAVRAAARGPVSLMRPEAWEASGESGVPADAVLVFDRHDPARVPDRDALFFAAVPPVPGLARRPTAGDAPAVQTFLTWDAADPAMRAVGLGGIPLVRPGRLVLPPGARVLASGLEGPLIARVRLPASGRRFLVVAPDPLQGRWPLSVGFAVFLVNAVDELSGAGGDAGVPGEGVAYETGGVAVARLAPGVPAPAPGGTARFTGPEAVAARVSGGAAVLPPFERAGWYRAADPGRFAPGSAAFAVNLADPAETDLRPPASLAVGAGGAVAAAGEAGGATVRRSWVPWVLAAAGVVLLLEWFVYTGRFAPTPTPG